MHVLALKRLRQFWRKHPQAEQPLREWYKDMEHHNFRTPSELREFFGNRVDQVDEYTIFDIEGNKFRLVVAMRYELGRVFVHRVMTHPEYDLWNRQGRP